MESLIEVKNIYKSYGGKEVLSNISFNVTEGSIHGFLGPNGAGKTTTLRILSGVIPTDSGYVQFSGKNIEENDHFLKSSLGALLENPPIYHEMKVREYLLFIAKLKKIPHLELKENVNYALNALKLDSVENRLIGNLSKGYKQRVGIAQALVGKPKLIILDEPTLGLDPSSVVDVRNCLKELGKSHTLLISSHLLHEMSLICDHVTIISEGRIVESNSMSNLLEKYGTSQKVLLSTLGDSTESLQLLVDEGKINNLEFISENTYELTIEKGDEFKADLCKMLINKGIRIKDYYSHTQALEDVFLELTKKEGLA